MGPREAVAISHADAEPPRSAVAHLNGRVDAVEKSGPAYKRITVKPAVDFSSLEEVLVVTTPMPAHETAQGVSE